MGMGKYTVLNITVTMVSVRMNDIQVIQVTLSFSLPFLYRFLLEQQDINGAWSAGPAGTVGDRKLVPPHASSLTPHSTHTLNLSISAHTMLTLMALKDLPSVSEFALRKEKIFCVY